MRFDNVHSTDDALQTNFGIETTLDNDTKDLIDHQSTVIHAPIFDRPNPLKVPSFAGRSRSLPNIGPTPPLTAYESSLGNYRSVDSAYGSFSDEDDTSEDEIKLHANESRDEYYTQSHRNIDEREQSSTEWVRNVLSFKTSQESSASISDAISSSLHGDIKSKSLSPGSKSGLKKRRKYESILNKPRYGSDGTSRSKVTSNVKFATLEIREFPTALGDNPGGLVGPPITLDWKHDEERTVVVSLEEYESKREPRREEVELWIPECLRRWKLLDRGVSMRKMQKAAKKAEKTRKERKITIASFKKSPEAGYFSGLKNVIKLLEG